MANGLYTKKKKMEIYSNDMIKEYYDKKKTKMKVYFYTKGPP